MSPVDGYKHRTLKQRVGTEGENQFRLMAGRQHLTVAVKVEEDFGVDFICQAEASTDAKETNRVIPAHFGVCVRATSTPDGRVSLNRADATNMLRYRQPMVFVLVHIADPGTLAACYHRVLDAEFGVMLSSFLDTNKGSMSLTPKDCRPEPAFRSDLMSALQPGATRQTQLQLASMRLQSMAPGITVEMRLDQHGETAVFLAHDYFDFFEKLPEEQRNSVYRAAFGRPALFDDRIRQLPFKSAIPAALVDAPSRILIGGDIVWSDAMLEISGERGQAKAAFNYTRIGTHSGWVHADGLALTMSIARSDHDGRMIHETRTFIDDQSQLRLEDVSADLHSFLAVAEQRGKLRDVHGGFEMEVEYFQLPAIGAIIRAHSAARQLAGWDPDALELRDLNDATSYETVAMLGAWSKDPSCFPKFEVMIEPKGSNWDTDTLEALESTGRITVVMDTARNAVLATVYAKVTELWHESSLVGLRQEGAQSVEVQFCERLPREESHPEIVLGEGLSLVIAPTGIRAGGPSCWREGLGYERLTI